MAHITFKDQYVGKRYLEIIKNAFSDEEAEVHVNLVEGVVKHD